MVSETINQSRSPFQRLFFPALALMILGSALGCDDETFQPPAPSIISASATALSPGAGEVFEISWETELASSVTVMQGATLLYATNGTIEMASGTVELLGAGTGKVFVRAGADAEGLLVELQPTLR